MECCVVATNGLTPAVAGTPARYGSAPGYGVADYDANLAFGSAGFSVLLMLNFPTRQAYDATYLSLGQPVVTFKSPIPSGGYAGIPKNGWGVWAWNSTSSNGFGLAFRYYDAYDGVDAARYRECRIRLSSDDSHSRHGLWIRAGFNKPASSSAVLASLNGAIPPTLTTIGTATVVGTPSPEDITAGGLYRAKVRYFHDVGVAAGVAESAYPVSCFGGAAGVWVLNKGDLSQGQLNAITADLAAFTAAVETTYLANLVARSYAGKRPWMALHDPPRGRRPRMLPMGG